MLKLLVYSTLLIAISLFLITPQASALPVSYNTTSISIPLTSFSHGGTSYDVFSTDLPTQLWFTFNNNTIDSSPNLNNLTASYNTNIKALLKLENSLTDQTGLNTYSVTGTTTYVNGHEGKGFSDDGASYISGGTSSLPTANHAMSVSVWVYSTDNSATRAVFSLGTNVATKIFEMYYLSPSHQIRIGDFFNVLLDSNATLNTNTWYNLIITWDGTTLKLYINGVLDKSVGLSARNITYGINRLGTNFNIDTFWVGTLDEYRIFNNALTQPQISALYMQGHFSQSYTFDGNENLSTNNVLYLDTATPFSFGTWIKLTDVSTTPLIFSIYDGSSGVKFFLSTNGYPTIQFESATGPAVIQSVNVAVNDGNYHNIVWVYNGNGSLSGVTVYIDNIAYVLTPAVISSFSVTNAGLFGSASTPTLDILTGQMDDTFFTYDAISPSQVSSYFGSPYTSQNPTYLINSWYRGTSGSPTLTKILGLGLPTLTLSCNLNTVSPNIIGNFSNVYYLCSNTLRHININTGKIRNDFSVADPGGVTNRYVFLTNTGVTNWSNGGGGIEMADKTGNFSIGGSGPASVYSNQRIIGNGKGLESNFNSTTTSSSLSPITCGLKYTPTGSILAIDNIVCDPSLPAKSIKYWDGLNIFQVGNYNTNSTTPFLSSIDSNTYKKLLTLPCAIIGVSSPCSTFILNANTNVSYFVVITSSNVYYGNAQTLLNYLNNNNYAFQSYDIITRTTTSNYEVPSPILQSLKLYGFSLNTTSSKFGMITLPSGYTTKTTSIESAIRTIDPRWSNDNTDIPIITSTSSLFPVLLTVTNSPVFSAVKVTNPYQIINNQEAVWSIAQLDSTRSVEFDLPSGVCVNVYVSDISVAPSIWNFQGIICATGTNQKTVSYTNTLPFTFWTYPWGVTHSFTPNTNILTTSVHHTAIPYTYTVILKNSTGGIITNSTITTSNTMDTQTYNITNAAKPVALYVYSGTGTGSQIYSAFAGSAISFASVATFFNQYLSYQGFSLLAFIPIVFASMFTRNTVGIGTVLTVLCVATLSWLSVIVIPDLYIYIMILIAILGMIAYRIYYG